MRTRSTHSTTGTGVTSSTTLALGKKEWKRRDSVLLLIDTLEYFFHDYEIKKRLSYLETRSTITAWRTIASRIALLKYREKILKSINLHLTENCVSA